MIFFSICVTTVLTADWFRYNGPINDATTESPDAYLVNLDGAHYNVLDISKTDMTLTHRNYAEYWGSVFKNIPEIKMPGDDHCAFHAIRFWCHKLSISDCDVDVSQLRQFLVANVFSNPESQKKLEAKWQEKMSEWMERFSSMEWATTAEIEILGDMFGIHFHMFQKVTDEEAQTVILSETDESILQTITLEAEISDVVKVLQKNALLGNLALFTKVKEKILSEVKKENRIKWSDWIRTVSDLGLIPGSGKFQDYGVESNHKNLKLLEAASNSFPTGFELRAAAKKNERRKFYY